MGLEGCEGSDERFSRYIEGLAGVIGHADRVNPLRGYCTGLMMPCERKSVEPMAAVTAPARTAAQHQSLLHFVGQAGWSDERVLAQICEMVLPALERHGPIEAWIIDDTGFPKKGRHSVLRAAGQAGQLPGGGIAVVGQSARELAGSLPTVSSGGLGGRCRAPQEGRRARGG
jgi:SRSO17 transposase